MPPQMAPRLRSYPSRRRKATMMPTTRAASTPSRRVTISASNMDRPPHRRMHRRRQTTALALGGFRATVAEARDLQRVPRWHKTVSAADLRLQRRDARADELDDAPATHAHQVVVLLPGVDVLVEEAPAAQPLLAGEPALHQQVEIAIDRGP